MGNKNDRDKSLTPIDFVKSNKLIAEFMGSPIPKDAVECCNSDNFIYKKHLIDCKYRSSWDWLMPVVEKIGNTCQGYSVAIGPLYTAISEGDEEPDIVFCNICQGDGNNRLDICYKAVVKFIKFYNRNKIKNGEK